MSSWICDGVPKDGKDYPGLGGAHEPKENYSPDCEICGLPRESIGNPKSPSSFPIKPILATAIAGIVLIGGASAVYFSGLLNGDRHLKTYEKAVASGEEALLIVETHTTPEELAQAQEYLSEAITQLSEIPQKASVYPEAEAKIDNYDTLSTQITSKLSSSQFQLCADPKPQECIF